MHLRKDNDKLTVTIVVLFILEWMLVPVGPLLVVVLLWHYLPHRPRFVYGMLGTLTFGICYVLVDWIRDLKNKIVKWLKAIRS